LNSFPNPAPHSSSFIVSVTPAATRMEKLLDCYRYRLPVLPYRRLDHFCIQLSSLWIHRKMSLCTRLGSTTAVRQDQASIVWKKRLSLLSSWTLSLTLPPHRLITWDQTQQRRRLNRSAWFSIQLQHNLLLNMVPSQLVPHLNSTSLIQVLYFYLCPSSMPLFFVLLSLLHRGGYGTRVCSFSIETLKIRRKTRKISDLICITTGYIERFTASSGFYVNEITP
jgi:hypothetical protein